MKVLETIIAIILGLTIGFALSGLIFWGIGSFIIWAFGITFTWTYWHGLAVAFIVWILSSIFKVTVKKD
ncbi:MAG: hypothetical protein HFJ30_00135 [Clostridia bacterium]|jgi:hypothetical protein|nr:hypothetical protein [Clostridia bacterium]